MLIPFRLETQSLSFLIRSTASSSLGVSTVKAARIYPSAVRPNPMPGVVTTSVVYVIVYNTALVKEADAPKTWDDLLNPRWDGKIGMWVRGEGQSDLAAIWGIDKVVDYVRKMNQLHPVLLPSTFPLAQQVAAGEILVGLGLNHSAQVPLRRGAPLKIVWNGAENYRGYWYAPKGTPRAKLAFQYLEFISHPKPQADFVKILPYGPPHPKAFEFISPETARKMPTNPANLGVSHVPDANWLAPHLPEIRERFSQWLAT